MGTREEQKEKRKQDILEAALDLFIRKGYAATSISDIAQKVGMSMGLMFHYFESKEKLYEELIRYGIAGPMNMMAQTGKEPIVFFEETADQIFTYIRENAFAAKMFVLMGQVYMNDGAPQNIRKMLKNFDIYTPTAELIREGQKNKTIREGDPYALGNAYWCAIQGIAEQIAIHPEIPCPESEWIVDIIRRREA